MEGGSEGKGGRKGGRERGERREEGREGGRGERREEGREGGRGERREEGREGARGKEGGREGGRERGRKEGGREEEGGRERNSPELEISVRCPDSARTLYHQMPSVAAFPLGLLAHRLASLAPIASQCPHYNRDRGCGQYTVQSNL